MAADHFCLRWNNYQSNMVSELDILRTEEHLVDVTLCCEGHKFRAHKVILSACSPYFRNVFKENPCEHPVVILKDVLREDVEALLSFIYQGVVYVSERKLSSFLQTAELLQIKGLAGAAQSFSDDSSNNKSQPAGVGSPVKRRKGAPVRLVKSEDGEDQGTMDTDPDSDPSNTTSQQHLIKAENFDSMQDLNKDDDSLLEDETGSENGCDGMVGMDEKSNSGWVGRPPPPLIDPSQASTPTSHANLSSTPSNLHPSGTYSAPSSNQGISDGSLAGNERNGRRPCPLCTKVISNKSNLLKHMRIRHSDVYNPACCVLCNKIFKNKYSLRAHLNIYHKQYINSGVGNGGSPGNSQGQQTGQQQQIQVQQYSVVTPELAPPPPLVPAFQQSLVQSHSVPVSEIL